MNTNTNFFACGLFVVIATLCACKGEGELIDYSILQLPPPVITIESQPTPVTNFIEGDVSGSLSVGATATRKGELNYQWYSAGANSNTEGAEIAGATDESFEIPKNLLAAGSPYYYFCEVRAIGVKGSVSDATPVRSNVAAVNVAPLPVITIEEQPAETTDVAAGSIAGSLSVSASVTEGATLSYQWYSNTTNSITGGSTISGATAASFTISATLAKGTYYYFCELSATGGAVSVRSDVATVNVLEKGTPIITIDVQPEKTSNVTAGSITGSLFVGASVTEGATLNYQWFSNTTESNAGGTEIEGATLAGFEIPKTLGAGTYYYFCELRATGAENKRSDAATVVVQATNKPIITINAQPEKTTNVTEGSISGNMSVSASVTEGAMLSYQWYRNTTESNAGGTETEIAGAMLATFIIPTTLTAAESPCYYFCEVRATGGAASVRSDVATVNVSEKGAPIIAIDAQPTRTTNVTEGSITGSLTVGASVTEGATLNYQWLSNTADSNVGGTKIESATAASFEIPKTLTAAGSPYYYFCELSATGAASARTEVATVTVAVQGVLPALSTNNIEIYTATTATICGNITNAGTPPYTERGVVYATTENPTTDDGKKTVSGEGTTGNFCAELEGLDPNTKYFARAYATNTASTRYGNQREFTTTGNRPTLTTNAVTNITTTAATFGGTIVSVGSPAYTERGVVYAKTAIVDTQEPKNTENQKIISGTGTGSFETTVDGLSIFTEYHARAYAINTEGHAYGAPIDFKTLDIPPEFTMNPITGITENAATLSMSVTNGGTPAYTDCGVAYATTANPTIADNKKTLSTTGAAGTFTSDLTGLTPGTPYYVRPYATNAAATRYGDEVTFIAKKVTVGAQSGVMRVGVAGSVTFSVTTVSIANGSYPATVANLPTGVTVQGQVTISNNNGTLTLSGITGTTAGSYTNLTLTINDAKSAAFTLTVSAPIAPTLTTNAPTNVTYESATLGGNITNAGTPAYTERGVVYATTQTPTTANSKKIISGSGTGNFSDIVTGLTAYTKYYVRAYVITPLGTIYGDEVTVTPFAIEMVSVTGGTFTMGSENSLDYNASPSHSVTLASYNIGKYQVTQGQWWAVMGRWPGTAPSSIFGVGDSYPMYYVSWNDIVGTSSGGVGYTINGITYYQNGFCYKLSQLAGGGKQYRLPTEAEWEFAARGGNTGKDNNHIYSGSDEIDEVAWYYGNNDPYGTKPVGGKLPNELGIYDMSGNVFELCGDLWGSYTSDAQTNPTGPESGSLRVRRGGSWDDYDYLSRVACRSNTSPDSRLNYFGFRLACSSN